MFKPGDVVLGSFVTENGVIRHYSVVLTGNVEGAMLVYTTSLKSQSSASQVFTSEDMKLAGWSKPCRWDASSVSLVPNECIAKVGRVSNKTLAAITRDFTRAIQQRSVIALTLTKEGEIVSV